MKYLLMLLAVIVLGFVVLYWVTTSLIIQGEHLWKVALYAAIIVAGTTQVFTTVWHFTRKRIAALPLS